MQEETFRLRLREVLREFSRDEICELCGFSIRSLSAYLSGANAPSVYAVARMAYVMDVSVDWLLGFRDERAMETQACGS